MATSFSLNNFLLFLKPTIQPPPPRTQLPISYPLLKKHPPPNGKFASLSLGWGSHSSQEADLAATLNPSLAYSNTLYFGSAYNVQVIVEENEPEEKLVNRFRREVMRAGVIQECKRRRFFENKQDERKRKARESSKRNRRRRPQSRAAFQNRQEASPTTKKDTEDDEDNWELPEGDLP